MRTSDTLSKIAPAMVAALAEMVNPPKTQTVRAGNYSYKFAPLPDIVDACRPILAKHKLVAMQSTETLDGLPAVVTMVMHESGEWVQSSPLIIAPKGQGPQDAGGALTYARRYSYSALLGLAADEDDDTHGQTHGGQAQGSPRQQAPTGGKTITVKQAGLLHSLIKDKASDPVATEKAISEKFGVTSFKEIPYAVGKALIDKYMEMPKREQQKADDNMNLEELPF